MLGCAPMTGDSVECFNCGRANPSWAQVCRSCGVPMRPEEIRELMQTMNSPKVVHVLPEEDDSGDGDR